MKSSVQCNNIRFPQTFQHFWRATSICYGMDVLVYAAHLIGKLNKAFCFCLTSIAFYPILLTYLRLSLHSLHREWVNQIKIMIIMYRFTVFDIHLHNISKSFSLFSRKTFLFFYPSISSALFLSLRVVVVSISMISISIWPCLTVCQTSATLKSHLENYPFSIQFIFHSFIQLNIIIIISSTRSLSLSIRCSNDRCCIWQSDLYLQKFLYHIRLSDCTCVSLCVCLCTCVGFAVSNL